MSVLRWVGVAATVALTAACAETITATSGDAEVEASIPDAALSLDSAVLNDSSSNSDSGVLRTPNIENPFGSSLNLFAKTYAFFRSTPPQRNTVHEWRRVSTSDSKIDAASLSLVTANSGRFCALGPLEQGFRYALQVRSCPDPGTPSEATCSPWSSELIVQAPRPPIPLEARMDEAMISNVSVTAHAHNFDAALGNIIADLHGDIHFLPENSPEILMRGMLHSVRRMSLDQGIVFRDSLLGNFGTAPFAFSFFVKSQNTELGSSDRSLLYEKGSGNGPYFRIRSEGESIFLETGLCPTLREEGFSNNQWHHIAVSREASSFSLRLYVDGRSTSVVTCAADLNYLGRLNFLPSFEGMADEFIFYPPSTLPYDHQIRNDCAAGFTWSGASLGERSIESDCRLQ